jgi:hypothetical protein
MRTRTGRFDQPGWLLLLACLSWGGVIGFGCRDPHRLSGTALFITADWDAGVLAVNQLRFTGTNGTQTIFGPALRPEDAGELALSPPETVRVLLPESLNNVPVNVEVDGLWSGREDSSGIELADIVQGFESDVSVVLQRIDAGADGGSDGGDGG